jgi:hypothetical protein
MSVAVLGLSLEVVSLLMIRDQGSCGSPLFIAASEGRVDAVTALLGKGANVNAGKVRAASKLPMSCLMCRTGVLRRGEFLCFF